jgi:hypothetical protein
MMADEPKFEPSVHLNLSMPEYVVTFPDHNDQL